MRALLGTVSVVTALLLVAATAPLASAATEFGSGCVSNSEFNGPNTLVQPGRQGVAPGAPAAGVATQWTMVSGSPTAVMQKLKIERRAGETSFTVIGESALVAVGKGSNTFDIRIPILAGDLIGLATPVELGAVLFCENTGQVGDEIAVLEKQDQPTGTTATYQDFLNGGALPIRVKVEPDADGDGFDDETQDACPTNASTQGACPPTLAPPALPPPPSVQPLPAPHPLALAVARKGSATVQVTTDVAGSVTVTGKAKLGGGASASLKSGPKTLAAGQTGSFTLKFPKALKAKLNTLPPKRKLKLAVTATVTNAAGTAGVKRLSLKLRGRG